MQQREKVNQGTLRTQSTICDKKTLIVINVVCVANCYEKLLCIVLPAGMM